MNSIEELDNWIAFRIMGWRIFKTTPEWVEAGKPLGRKITVLDQDPRFKIPAFSTTPMLAMQVLEICCKKIGSTESIKIRWDDGQWEVQEIGFDASAEVADTLELAICKFAKTLFSK